MTDRPAITILTPPQHGLIMVCTSMLDDAAAALLGSPGVVPATVFPSGSPHPCPCPEAPTTHRHLMFAVAERI